ncbi:MAG: LptF/LptG family permease [Planctomycetes bacterium]|nr:LptF/LptG family permease [Planctomycetota bacterium]
MLPNALRFAVPGTLLFSACSVYGRMSAHNEISAIKSLGISPWVIIFPGLVLAFLFSLLTVWLNDVAVSWGRHGMQRVVIESIEQIAYSKLRTQKAYSTPNFSISVKRVVDKTLIRPTLVLQGSGDSPASKRSSRCFIPSGSGKSKRAGSQGAAIWRRSPFFGRTSYSIRSTGCLIRLRSGISLTFAGPLLIRSVRSRVVRASAWFCAATTKPTSARSASFRSVSSVTLPSRAHLARNVWRE